MKALKRRPTRWARISGRFAALSVALYLLGAFSMLRLENSYHTCTDSRFGYPDGPGLPPFIRLDERFFPPSAVCRWQDGHSLDLVPSFVSPALLICLAVSVAAAVVATVKRLRAGRTE
ncbi:hypothetical protein OHA77_02920 [Streptosporangium sp. NBC_01639]|uniref:hypothetical protein n=1 Tax=Streptosporangium sp. NBC_01639 TaxID=2975948 RepID=UPI00386E95B9|nr:hypothetical protein OHA77_02920 [Streptosporangium sp. NBC_01639]